MTKARMEIRPVRKPGSRTWPESTDLKSATRNCDTRNGNGDAQRHVEARCALLRHLTHCTSTYSHCTATEHHALAQFAHATIGLTRWRGRKPEGPCGGLVPPAIFAALQQGWNSRREEAHRDDKGPRPAPTAAASARTRTDKRERELRAANGAFAPSGSRFGHGSR